MLYQLLSLIAFCFLSLAAFGTGRPLVRGLGIEEDDRMSVVVWSIALGLIAAGTLLAVLGLVNLLYVPLIFALTAVGCIWGLWEIVRVRLFAETTNTAADLADGVESYLAEEDDISDSPALEKPPVLVWCLMAAALLACVGSLIGALAPPTAGDALCYHLELPKAFLLEHKLAYLPYNDNSTFPLLVEMWFMWGLALGGGVCAQLVHWGLGLLLAAGAVVLAKPIIGDRWAPAVGAVVLLTPGVNNQMTAPLNDVALAAMTTLALAAWYRAVVDETGRSWLLAAGLAGGAAMGTKYIAAVFAIAVAVTWLWAIVRHRAHPRRRRFLIEAVATVAVVAASVSGMWYVRSAWHRGNPVYPFLGEVFHAGSDGETPTKETLPASKSRLGRGIDGLAVAPWQITMRPERFGGRGHQLGVLLLATLPGLIFARRLRGLGILLVVAAGYFFIWFMLRQNVRFLFPVVPLLAVAVVWVWMEMARLGRWPRAVATTVLAATVIAMALVPLKRSGNQFRVALGLESREDYLLRTEPAYGAALVANIMMKPGERVLSQDYRAFHFNGHVVRENIYRREEHYDRQVTDPTRLSDHLLSAGFKYLLLAETVPADDTRFDPTLSRMVDAQLRGPTAKKIKPVTEYFTDDADGLTRRYRLMMLR